MGYRRTAVILSLRSRKALIVIITLVFSASVVKLKAQCAYGACLGVTDFDLMIGCRQDPGWTYCTQRYVNTNGWCDSNCAWSIVNGQECYDTTPTCGWRYTTQTGNCCPGVPPEPVCEDSSPAIPVLVTPVDLAACFTSNVVRMDWNAVTSWGENCDGNTNRYRVFVNGVRVAEVGSAVTEYDYTGTWGSNNTWYIQASNGARTRNSVTRSFELSACTRIVGRMWEDLNGNNGQDGTAELWSHNPPPAAGCSTFMDNDISLMVRDPVSGLWSSNLGGWACNSGSYYYSTYLSLHGGPGTIAPYTIRVLTPDVVDYPGSYVAWTYARCGNVGCTFHDYTSSGTTDTAAIPISDFNGIDWTNHLQWEFEKNKAPTATISTVVGPGHTSTVNGQPVYFVRSGNSQPFSVSMADTRPNAQGSLGVGRRPFDPLTRIATTDAATYLNVGTYNSCTGLGCSTSITDATTQAGYYIYYPMGQDEISLSSGVGRTTNRCSGHPGVHDATVLDWADCDINHVDGYQDEAVTWGDTIPVCTQITGPANLYEYAEGSAFKYPESIGFYSLRTSDVDGNEVRHTWSPPWASTVSNYPTVTRVKIYAAGTTADGIGPLMQLYIGRNDLGGERIKAKEWRVSNINPAMQEYATDIGNTYNFVSSLDIVFPDDLSSGGDRNLYIDRVEVTYELAPGGPVAVRTLYPYTQAGSGAVYYDRGAVVFAPYSLHSSWFDGQNAAESLSTGVFGAPAGAMYWSGALSFPIPLRAGTVGGTYNLTGTPTVPLPYYDGNNCPAYSVSIEAAANLVYSIEGTVYLRNSALTCPLQNVGTNTKVENANMTVVDGNGVLIPGATVDTTDVSGNYTISNIPVGYRENSPGCPTCYARVCMEPSDPDLGVYISQCSEVEPPLVAPSNWADSVLCSPPVYTIPIITSGFTATVNLGLDYYQNEKWSVVLDGDVYTPGMTFDIATAPGNDFSSDLVNRRALTTLGGFVFVDSSSVDLGIPLTESNLFEYGGYARNLSNIAGGYDFSDKWLSTYTPTFPIHARVLNNVDPIVGAEYVFDSSNVYTYDLAQFETWYNNPAIPQYNITATAGVNIAIVYVIGDVAGGERLNLNKSVKTSNVNEGLILVTNLPIDIDDTVEIPSTYVAVPGGTMGVGTYSGNLTAGYLDFIILSTGDINMDSRYNDTCELVGGVLPDTCKDFPVVIYGSLISKTGVLLNRDLWHISNSKFPAEMVRYFPELLPNLTKLERSQSAIPGFTGFSTFDIQTVYE